VNTIKTVFLAALLSAAAYGVYVGVTGSPPSFGPRRKAQRDWNETSPADPFAENSDATGAPVVSVEAASAPPPTNAPATPAAGEAPPAAVAPSASSPLAMGQADPTASGPSQSPLAGQAAADGFSSNQPYPSTRPDVQSVPSVPGAERTPNATADRYAPDQRYPSTDTPAEPPGGIDERPDQPEDIHAEFVALMQSVQTLLAQNQLAAAHLELSEWFGDPRFSPEEDAQVTDLLDRLAGTVIYSRQHLLERPYEIQPGDSLEKIADAYEVPWQLLANINGIHDPRDMVPGGQLKVVKGPFSAYVSLSKLHLVLYLGNRYAGRFRIGVGTDHALAESEFIVLKKQVNPTYYGQAVIDKDDPNNPLGEYALDLGNGILIHGTNDPASIGQTGARGCVRLSERDIRDVFNILTARGDRTAGSKVTIRR